MTTIARAVNDIVQADPTARCVLFRDLGQPHPFDEELSYGELWARACGVAEHLQDLPRGAHVMLVLPLGLPLLVAHLAVQLQGGVASIFTHPSEKIQKDVYEQNLRSAIERMRPDAIITVRAYISSIEAALQESQVCLIWEEIGQRRDYTPRAWHSVASDNPAIVQYSSGSTGLQKCVQLNHGMVLRQAESYGRFIGLDPSVDRVCSWLPLYHDMGLFTSWLIPLTQKIPVSLIDPFQWVRQPASILQLISQTGGTLCWQPNFAYKLLTSRVQPSDMSGIDLSRVRGFSNCSEPVSPGIMDAFAARFSDVGLNPDAMWTCYAMAENAFAVTAAGGPSETYRTVNISRSELAVGRVETAANGEGISVASCGVPIEGCEVDVVDDLRQSVGEGRVGEIRLRSPFALTEYVRAPELTSQAIDAGGWFHTGDLGFLLRGRLYITGRKKDLIIVAGRNFYPQDIEEIAGQVDGVIPGRVVALGVDDEDAGTQKIIVIAESHMTEASDTARIASSIRQAVFHRLDCPVADVRIVPHMWLLKTSSGKIARQPNLERYRTVLSEAPSKIASPGRDRKATILETMAWGLATAMATYLYVLFFLLGDSKSWNIYAGF